MALSSGARIGPFEILAPLGAGGMGEVHRARDTRLGREVALKVLPDTFASDPERLARFDREARTLAALNHPNIVTIHSVEEAAGVHFITMELVEGQTLTEIISKQSLPLDRFLKIAIPLAGAVSAAHRRGIMHRDLKPGNVMVSRDGSVKVLDFGLAKVREEATIAAAATAPTAAVTAEGRILGTVAYMSPEQAEGKTVDHRSDIFSLGIIFYEMATGQRPFAGDSSVSVLSSIIKDTPRPITDLNPHLPRELARIVRRCLSKDPDRRYESAWDLHNDLEELRRDLEGGATAAAAPVARPIASRWGARRWIIAAAFLSAFALGALAGVRFGISGSSAPIPELGQRPLTANPRELPLYGAAISPDGRYLAYTDQNGVFLRLIDTGETSRIQLPEGSSFWEVTWFPDGTRLLLTGPSAGGETMSLYSVPVLGGTPRRLQDDAWRASVSPDGAAIAFLRSTWPIRDVWLMGANGERPRRVATGAAGQMFWQVGWSPDGSRIIYGTSQFPAWSIRSCDIQGGDERTILKDRQLFQAFRGILPFVWLADGRLLYARSETELFGDSSNLWELDVDAKGSVLGQARRLTATMGTIVRALHASHDGGRLSVLRERY